MQTLRQRLTKSDEGFTLIELMVVVLIIAILIAIAIPTFLGAQDRARDRGAQSDLRNALTAAKTIATDSSGFFTTGTPAADIDDADMDLVEPSLEFDTFANAQADSSLVGVLVADSGTTLGTSITLLKVSASGTGFCISATNDGVVTYGRADDPADIVDATDCVAASW
jgi:type IV pilus assembly protein PilA